MEINNGSSSKLPTTKQYQQQQFTMERQQRMRKVQKVQVVYYLSRNGQLEHPHFMEFFLASPDQNLYLKDVLERLSALRGRDMPALYSWSCKMSYKHGYVWNDLAEDDVICPTQGAEYVLKGSELLQASTEKLDDLRFVKSNYHSYQKQSTEEESSYSFSTNTPTSRCSVGISTDDIHLISPPSLSSTSSDQPIQQTRNSVLLQLIACGSSTIGLKNRFCQRPKVITQNTADHSAVKSCNKQVMVECTSPVDDDVAMIGCMSENPRFGGFQTEKEYFSGSVVEAVAAAERVAGEPFLMKLKERCNSFNEERRQI